MQLSYCRRWWLGELGGWFGILALVVLQFDEPRAHEHVEDVVDLRVFGHGPPFDREVELDHPLVKGMTNWCGAVGANSRQSLKLFNFLIIFNHFWTSPHTSIQANLERKPQIMDLTAHTTAKSGQRSRS